jgi:hypothetical protein
MWKYYKHLKVDHVDFLETYLIADKKEMKGIFFFIPNQPQDIALYFRSNGRMLSMLWIYQIICNVKI